MPQIRKNISLDKDTACKLKELAAADHKSVSQWLTDRIWEKAGRPPARASKKKKQSTRQFPKFF